jgi:hypothetical protein
MDDIKTNVKPAADFKRQVVTFASEKEFLAYAPVLMRSPDIDKVDIRFEAPIPTWNAC